MPAVLIRGDGVAARCCGHLLTQAGYGVSFERLNRPRVPMIMLGEAAQRLIADIFGKNDLFVDLPMVFKRVVSWGGDVVELNHWARVASEEILLNRLNFVSSNGAPDWTICAASSLPASTSEHRFGTRKASAVKVELKASARNDACWIEALKDGWLFLNCGWLLAVGGRPEALLAESKLIRGQIHSCDAPVTEFPASPRIVTPLGGDQWIACGTAAMAFDPLCGDGTAHAVREAILACAVIRAADRGEQTADLIAHYESRLTAGFHRHLGQCRDFYSSGGTSAWWKTQEQACTEGLEWCSPATNRNFKYRLDDLELKKI